MNCILRVKNKANSYPTKNINKNHTDENSFPNWSEWWLWMITWSQASAETWQTGAMIEQLVCVHIKGITSTLLLFQKPFQLLLVYAD